MSAPRSSLNGETDACALGIDNDALSQPNLSMACKTLKDSLSKALLLPQSGLGYLTALRKFSGDMRLLESVTANLIALPIALQLCNALIDDTVRAGVDFKVDEVEALSLQDVRAKILAEPSGKLRPAERKIVLAMRGMLLLVHIKSSSQIASTIAATLNRWKRSGLPAGLADGPSPLSSENMQAIRDALPAAHDDSKLLTFLIDNWPPTDLSVATPSTKASSRTFGSEWKPAAAASATELAPIEKEPADFLLARRREVIHAKRAVRAGIDSLSDCLRFEEVETFLPLYVRRLLQGNDSSALAAVIALLLRVRPTDYPQIPLSRTMTAGVYVDISAGYFCWNLDEVIANKSLPEFHVRRFTDRFVQIPLPTELVTILADMQHARPAAQTLDALFGLDVVELERSAKAFVREMSAPTHRVSLKRLIRSWGRFLLRLCTDETIAAGLSADFTLGSTTNFNYVWLSERVVTPLLHDAYRRVGFSGTTAPFVEIGSKRLIEDSTAQQYLENNFKTLHEQLSTLPRRTSNDELIARHETIVIAAYRIFKFLSGARAAALEKTTSADICLKSGLLRIEDKLVSEFLEMRLILMPQKLNDALAAYFVWLKVLSYRTHGTRIATRVSAALHQDRDASPLFFRISKRGIPLPMGSGDIRESSIGVQLTNNVGRHWLDSVLRRGGVDSAALNFFFGRGNPGQHAVELRSNNIPIEVLRNCVSAIDAKLAAYDLPSPPVFKPRGDRHGG